MFYNCFHSFYTCSLGYYKKNQVNVKSHIKHVLAYVLQLLLTCVHYAFIKNKSILFQLFSKSPSIIPTTLLVSKFVRSFSESGQSVNLTVTLIFLYSSFHFLLASPLVLSLTLEYTYNSVILNFHGFIIFKVTCIFLFSTHDSVYLPPLPLLFSLSLLASHC